LIVFAILTGTILAVGIARGKLWSYMGGSVSRADKPELFWFVAASWAVVCACSLFSAIFVGV
jgi:hypothetical protein